MHSHSGIGLSKRLLLIFLREGLHQALRSCSHKAQTASTVFALYRLPGRGILCFRCRGGLKWSKRGTDKGKKKSSLLPELVFIKTLQIKASKTNTEHNRLVNGGEAVAGIVHVRRRSGRGMGRRGGRESREPGGRPPATVQVARRSLPRPPGNRNGAHSSIT